MDVLADLIGFKSFLLAALIFLPLEHILPLHPEQKIFRRGWLNDLTHVVLTGLIVGVALAVEIVAIIAVSDWLVPAGFKQMVADQPLLLQALELILLADLGFYCVHRLFHTIPFLWRFHAVHHSIEEMDWLAAHRVHPVDQILTKGASLIPCFALGFSTWTIIIFFGVYKWQSLLLHSNVKLNFGPLRWLVASPEFHHWHHGCEQEAHDKNFAAQSPFWDVVFGTLHMPRGRSPIGYGINDPVPRSYVDQLLYPFRENVAPPMTDLSCGKDTASALMVQDEAPLVPELDIVQSPNGEMLGTPVVTS